MQRDLQRPSLGSGETPGVAARVIGRPTHLARETTPLAWRAEVSQSCERLAVAARFGALAALAAAAAHWRPWHMCTRFESQRLKADRPCQKAEKERQSNSPRASSSAARGSQSDRRARGADHGRGAASCVSCCSCGCAPQPLLCLGTCALGSNLLAQDVVLR